MYLESVYWYFSGVDGQTYTVTIVSSPAGTPVSGSTNTFDYPILSSVTLTCNVVSDDGSLFTVIAYQWNTAGCCTHSNHNNGNPSCFPHGNAVNVMTNFIYSHMLLICVEINWTSIVWYKILEGESCSKTVHTKNWWIIFWWMPRVSKIPKIIIVIVSAKTLHVRMQVLAFFPSLKSHNSVTAQWNITRIWTLMTKWSSYILE